MCVLRIHSDPRWLRASPRSFCLHTLATLTPRLTALVLRDYTGEMAAHLTRMLVPRGAGPVPCPSLASVTYITLGRTCECPVREGRFVLAPPAPSSPGTTFATPTLNVIFTATIARARALHRSLPRLIFCYPSAPHEYVLENAYGIERVEVRRADAWAAAPGVDGVFERWAGLEGRYKCSCPVGSSSVDQVRNAHRQARAARRMETGVRTPGLEEEYEAVWAAERARAEAERVRLETQIQVEGRALTEPFEGTPAGLVVVACAQAQGTCYDPGASSLGSKSEPEAKPEPEPTAGPSMHGREHAHPYHPAAASTRADARLDLDGDTMGEAVAVLVYFGLFCSSLSLCLRQHSRNMGRT